jgi:hypothetical protein
MNTEYKDFIAIFHNVYPEGYCKFLIDEYERLVELGAGYTRQEGENAFKHNKNDLQLSLNFNSASVGTYNNVPVKQMFFDGLQKCFNAYTEEFSILKNGKIYATDMKMQRTDPGGGYHVWHCEQNNGIQSSRVLVYMLYLNSLSSEEAGETEFLYQQRRINPQENTIVLWPATFTHAHRGNTVFGSRSKYVITGWFYYQ